LTKISAKEGVSPCPQPVDPKTFMEEPTWATNGVGPDLVSPSSKTIPC
jgi:hypothetical protein